MKLIEKQALERETRITHEVVSAITLPQNIRSYEIEPGEDFDGDPVMFVRFDVQDPNHRDQEQVQRLLAFRVMVRDLLSDKLDDYRPEVSVR